MMFSMRSMIFAVVAVAVACRAAISAEELAEKSAAGLALIELEPGVEPTWVTQGEKLELLKQHVGLFDVTYSYRPPSAIDSAKLRVALSDGESKKNASVSYPPPSKQRELTPLIGKVSLPTMQSYLTNLTNFHNRYYESETGAAASVWIRDTLLKVATTFPKSKATVSLFKHNFTQSSIIAKIPGKNAAAPITILGAHMDSINLEDVTGRAPGADDDGSGSVNLMEAFRVLVTSGFRPSTPVEFHWYAGEEAGLFGSQAIADSYKAKDVKVKAMMEFDMTAFVKPGSEEVISLMPDFTNANLTSFIGSLVDTYTRLPWNINNPCGYACSDHASWDKHGYPTALPFEGVYPDNANEDIHSAIDTVGIPGFSWNHTLEYTKLAVAYAYELSA